MKMRNIKLSSIILCFIALAIATVTRTLSNEEQESIGVERAYSSPFLVLLSHQDISIVQLPLIDNGRIIKVYSLLDNSTLVDEEDDETISQVFVDATEGSDKKKIAADAREREQQMPSNSLRKFFGQQIAGSKVASHPEVQGMNQEEVVGVKNSSSSSSNSNSNNNSKREGEEVAANTEQEGRRRINERKRRASNSNNDMSEYSSVINNHDKQQRGNDHTITNISTGKNKNEDGNRVKASSFVASESAAMNVTSARFTRSNRNQRSAQGGSPSPEGDAKNSDAAAAAVQFSDFDVHISLGYVFVADSTGRVHRFRLAGFATEKELETIKLNDENLMENDYYANTITSDPILKATDFSPSLRSSSSKKPATSSSFFGSRLVTGVTEEKEASASTTPTDIDGDDANRVSSAASHKQFGQHPAVSGIRLSTNKQTRSTALTSEQNSINYNNKADDESTIRKQQSTLERQQQHDQRAEKPKIIWSRMKHGLSSVSTTLNKISDETLHSNDSTERHKQPPVEGALPLNLTELSGKRVVVASAGDEELTRNSTANHMEGAEQVSLSEKQPKPSAPPVEIESEQATAIGVNNPADECALKLAAHFQTEIAVDWVNNILFVLDKCRLVLVDFNGNNELLLIDDFDSNNRPMDIKVDPLNDFLFWLQVGTFENTIYRLDLNSITERLLANSVNLMAPNNRATGTVTPQYGYSNTQLVALTSRNYAHPIIFDLPQHAKIFTIDYKHSRIYVPLAPSPVANTTESSKSQQYGDTVVFLPPNPNQVTHLNTTTSIATPHEPISFPSESSETLDGSISDLNSTSAQIRAYKLDGTDRGLFRGANGQIHLSDLSELQDIALDSDRGLIFWLTNGGKDLLEELASDSYQTAQHSLEGSIYKKMIYFGNVTNQPKPIRARFSLKRLINMISSTNTHYRWIRNPVNGDLSVEASRLNFKHQPVGESLASSNTPLIILAITFLVVLSIYLLYTLIFQHNNQQSTNVESREGSIGGRSSPRDSHIDGDLNPERSMEASTISRWIGKPNAQALVNQTRASSGTLEHNNLYDIESNNYHESNAIDEHYRNIMNSPTLSELDANRLANLSQWPMNLNDLSNKLYVPIEVLQDEALASINRISIDQLEIERRNPLGEGNFGTVLQGVITSTDKNSMLTKPLIVSSNCAPVDVNSFASSFEAIQRRRVPIPSSSSSGHGSSMISTEFITANSCATTSNDDYLTPKSNCNSTMSDYHVDVNPSKHEIYCGYNNSDQDENRGGKIIQTKLRVAIKKLKDNASADEKRDFLQEAKLLASFNHPNIVHLIGICLDRGSTLIVMELMLGGDLIRYMQENTPKANNQEILTNDDLLTICLDIVNGCCYLEELNYIHRDLAARNCLVSSRKKEERVVKLADFGLARDIYKDSYYKKLNDSAMPLKWMAPECLIEQKFTMMSDVWSFGVVMWEVMSYCQEKPYGNVEPIFMKEHLTGGARLKKPKDCSDEIYKLMNECWQMDPNVRPTFQECRATLIEIKNSRR